MCVCFNHSSRADSDTSATISAAGNVMVKPPLKSRKSLGTLYQEHQ